MKKCSFRRVSFTLFIIMPAFLIISCSGKKNDAAPGVDKQKNTQNAAAPISQNGSTNSARYEYPNDFGIGPVKDVTLGQVDQVMASKGLKVFIMKCASCHSLDSRNVGPALRNITRKNTPAFIMNYLLNTTEMVRKDPLIQKLVEDYKVIMPDQQLTRDDARVLLEYFRSEEK